MDHLRPAELRVASGETKGKIAYNYYAPDLYDRRAAVLQVRGTDGQPIGTLVNYAIHPEVLGSKQGILSPDLAGPLYDALEKSAGGVAVFMNGAQGGMVTADVRILDQPARDAARAYWNDKQTWSECERIGGLLASESLRLIQPGAPGRKLPALRNLSRQVRFPVQSDEMWMPSSPNSPLKYPHNPDRSVTVRMNLLHLGNAQILTIPGEALPNIGFYLKRNMQGRTQLPVRPNQRRLRLHPHQGRLQQLPRLPIHLAHFAGRADRRDPDPKRAGDDQGSRPVGQRLSPPAHLA